MIHVLYCLKGFKDILLVLFSDWRQKWRQKQIMKQSKQSQLIHIWEDYEFYLSIPKTFTGSNKPYVYFYYLDSKTKKREWIRK
ncbi:hypothetical protein DBR40_13155 [Pedobacter sp. KBW01]|nr:hypothetical protein DBR40_13155 [Pedobacter sp. KBW01]